MTSDTKEMPTAALVGERWAAILRRRYPGPFAAKRAARELGRDPRTVEAWLAGQAPLLHMAIAAAVRWRDPLLLFELAGVAPPTEAEIAAGLDEMRRDLDRLAARIAELRGGG